MDASIYKLQYRTPYMHSYSWLICLGCVVSDKNVTGHFRKYAVLNNRYERTKTYGWKEKKSCKWIHARDRYAIVVRHSYVCHSFEYTLDVRGFDVISFNQIAIYQRLPCSFR